MKNLIYLYLINDRYSDIEQRCFDYDYVSSFVDDFGTSKALRMNAYKPKNDKDSKEGIRDV